MTELNYESSIYDDQDVFASTSTQAPVISPICNDQDVSASTSTQAPVINTICNDQDVSASTSTQAPIINLICNDQDISTSTSTQAPLQMPEVVTSVMTDSNLFDNESDGLDDLSDSVELISGLTFSNWEEFKIWLNGFVLKNRFSYKVRTSEITNGVMKRATYKCTKSSLHVPQVTSDPTKSPEEADASQMLQLLLDWKDLELLWVVKPCLDSVSRRLNSLFWMSPIQRELYSKYNDVIVVDTTYNTNWFRMLLCIIAIIDNNYKTRIVASAIIEDKTLDTYQ
ncbi:8164_t:CDS:2 [Racocetra persica]|uniref:8164_t:CDS:1 n=1 Tax=Racocetra persica TaxID=160502 RepID=A0ACA9PN69_9GLOM|nr:8164_t:CDS:2 [Racocetra persica]